MQATNSKSLISVSGFSARACGLSTSAAGRERLGGAEEPHARRAKPQFQLEERSAHGLELEQRVPRHQLEVFRVQISLAYGFVKTSATHVYLCWLLACINARAPKYCCTLVFCCEDTVR